MSLLDITGPFAEGSGPLMLVPALWHRHVPHTDYNCSHHNEELVAASSGTHEEGLCWCVKMSSIIIRMRDHLEAAASR